MNQTTGQFQSQSLTLPHDNHSQSTRVSCFFEQELAKALPENCDIASQQQSQNSPVLLTTPPGLYEPLSEREVEVLLLVSEGLSNREIARRLVITS